MSGIQQMLTGGTYKAPGPTTIGQAYGGGFYAGKISTTANGVATHYLIVAPAATGQTTAKAWGIDGVNTGATSKINGPTNTTTLAALGADYQAAVFCDNLNAGAGLNGYTDWYLPAKNELEVLYYFLKPTTDTNVVGGGSNANAVSPEPVNSGYTSGSPAQTTATAFQSGSSEAFSDLSYWNSSEGNANLANYSEFSNGSQASSFKSMTRRVRAVRRIPV